MDSLFLLKKEVLFWINYQGVIVAEIEAFMNESKEEVFKAYKKLIYIFIR